MHTSNVKSPVGRMRARAARRLTGLLVAFLCAASANAAAETAMTRDAASPASGTGLDVAAIGWNALSYSRSSVWASVSSRIILDELSADALSGGLPPVDPAQPEADRLLLLRAENEAASNLERISTWFDPAAGTLIHRCRVAYGSNDRRAKCYRYEGGSVWRERRESTGSGEPETSSWLDADATAVEIPDWTVSSRVELPRPASIPADAGLVSPMMLFPLASAAALERTGDSQDVFVHTDRDFFRVTLRLKSRETIGVEYQATAADGSTRKVAGQVRALVVALEPRAEGRASEDFTLLGMSGPLQILLDPTTRAPLAVRGRAPWIGQTELQLKSVQLTR